LLVSSTQKVPHFIFFEIYVLFIVYEKEWYNVFYYKYCNKTGFVFTVVHYSSPAGAIGWQEA